MIHRTNFFPPSYLGQILTLILRSIFSALTDFTDSNCAPLDIFISVILWTYSNHPHNIFHYPAHWWHILMVICRTNFFPPSYLGQILTLILRSIFSALTDFADSKCALWDIFISVSLWTYSNYPHDIIHYPAHWWHILMVIRWTNYQFFLSETSFECKKTCFKETFLLPTQKTSYYRYL